MQMGSPGQTTEAAIHSHRRLFNLSSQTGESGENFGEASVVYGQSAVAKRTTVMNIDPGWVRKMSLLSHLAVRVYDTSRLSIRLAGGISSYCSKALDELMVAELERRRTKLGYKLGAWTVMLMACEPPAAAAAPTEAVRREGCCVFVYLV